MFLIIYPTFWYHFYWNTIWWILYTNCCQNVHKNFRQPCLCTFLQCFQIALAYAWWHRLIKGMGWRIKSPYCFGRYYLHGSRGPNFRKFIIRTAALSAIPRNMLLTRLPWVQWMASITAETALPCLQMMNSTVRRRQSSRWCAQA